MATVTGQLKGKVEGLRRIKNLMLEEHVVAREDFRQKCKEDDELEFRASWKRLKETNKRLNDLNAEFLEAFSLKSSEEELKCEFEAQRVEQTEFLKCEVLFEERSSRKPEAPHSETNRDIYRLPRLDLKTFDGAPNEWLPFWHQFKRIHEDEGVKKGDKLQYLYQFTSGKVRDLVASYPQIEENYEVILEHVKERFANKKLLIRYYVNEILKLVLDSKVKYNLESLYGSLETKLRALDTLGVTRDSYCDLLLPLVEAALPEDVLILWHRQGSQNIGKQGELQALLDFLGREVESRSKVEETGYTFNSKRVMKGPVKVKEKGGTAAALMQMTDNQVCCIFCGKTNHKSLNCFSANKFSLDERKKIIMKTGACFHCLRVGHKASQCKAEIRCSNCQGKHSSLLCGQTGVKKEEGKSFACFSCKSKENSSFLPTLLVKVANNKVVRTVRALIDSGCQKSYILESLAKELRLKPVGQEVMANCLFGGVVSKQKKYNLYDCVVSNLGNNWSISVNALGEEVICNFVPSVGVEVVKRFPEITFTDFNKDLQISIVLGADVFGQIFDGSTTVFRESLTAIETKLGWVLTGPRSVTGCLNLMTICLKNSVLPNLWELDTIGIKDPPEVKKNVLDEETMLHFKNNISRDEEGRYSVALPWLLDHPVLDDNRSIAERRLLSMSDRLWKNKLIEMYESVLDEWLNLGIIEVVPEEELRRPCHYLAHRPVVKMAKQSTKVRPVFDASCSKEGSPSLNECLSKGPNLLEVIVPLLMKYRLYRYGVVADIEKAFLQIGLKESDRDFLRFLWWKKDKFKEELLVYRHRRLVFGVCCSPFLLNATISYHLSNFKEENVNNQENIRKLASSFYMDDCVTSVSSMDELEKFVSVSVNAMSDACFNLRGWKHNDPEGLDTENLGETSVLGLIWDLKADSLSCGFQFDNLSVQKPFTKRKLLSITNKIFDPLGFLCPVALVPKLLLQQVWKLKCFWDEELPSEISDKFRLWARSLNLLSECRIPRWIFSQDVNWNCCSLHVFCDASSAAYAACIFLRAEEDDGVRIQLLLAKSRVSPLKEITIPRLELLSACIGTRLAVTVQKTLPVKLNTTYWTDSSVVLAWIRRKDQWNTFVRNRITEIRENSEIDNWRHVPGKINPADLPSRGCDANKLLERAWWNGPEWLLLNSDEWPNEEGVVDESEVLSERKKGVCLMVLENESFLDSFTKYFSSYERIVRMCAWMLRFSHKLRFLSKLRKVTNDEERTEIQLKLEGIIGELSNEEIMTAELCLLKLVQKEFVTVDDLKKFGGLQLFKDEIGVIRVQTRLTMGLDEDYFQNPIILNDHELVRRLIKRKHVDLGHAGVLVTLSRLREKFFIIRGRQLVRKVVKSCVICKKALSKPLTVSEAPLPIERLERVSAFQVTGVDLGGPLFLRKGGKVWFVLFTCAVYRAVHLELVKQLNTEAFILALRRFLARRGRIRIMYSDRGTNFVGTNNLLNRLDWDRLQRESTLQRISWRFNPPAAPWWGGWWERLVGLVKTALRKTVGKAYLSYVELETVLCDIESTINSRPLTYMSEDPSDLTPLTPAHFIQDLPGDKTTDFDNIEKRFLGKRLRYVQGVRAHLRERFKKEYLADLINRGQRKNKMSEIKVGDLVLVEDHTQKRVNWPLGRVLELIPGRDGKCRVAKLKLQSGQLTRPVQRLYPLEVETDSAGVVKDILKTRSGRVVKPVKRLNL